MEPPTKTMAEVQAERRTQLSPGRRFVEAYRAGETAVDFDVTITDSLTSSRRKPRYPCRNMLKVVDMSREPRTVYWHESLDADVAGSAELRKELSNSFAVAPVPELLPTRAWVQLPDGVADDDVAFETFLNYRLVVRLATQENHTILAGGTGLLAWPGIEWIKARRPIGSAILTACDQVEQMGCTADGLVINPVDYYRYLDEGPLIDTLERNGVFVVRTRLVEPGTALVGDFGHGAQLFDAGRSTMRIADPPPGTFAQPGTAVLAEIHERVVVNLPFTFYLVRL